jgi:hypothetical protein
MVNLKLGDVVTIGGQVYVVGTIAGLPPVTWSLVPVPAGQEPRDLGKTWSRSASETLTLFAQPAPVPVANLEGPPSTATPQTPATPKT